MAIRDPEPILDEAACDEIIRTSGLPARDDLFGPLVLWWLPTRAVATYAVVPTAAMALASYLNRAAAQLRIFWRTQKTGRAVDDEAWAGRVEALVGSLLAELGVDGLEAPAEHPMRAAELTAAGAHLVVDSIAGLPGAVEEIEARLAHGERR